MGSHQSERRESRRTSAQYDVRLLLSRDILDADLAAGSVMPLLLRGYTRDLCEAGLGLVVPAISMDERECMGKYPVRVAIQLSGEPVEVVAETVRCEPLDEREPLEGYLIGARVKELSDEARQRLGALLRSDD